MFPDKMRLVWVYMNTGHTAALYKTGNGHRFIYIPAIPSTHNKSML
jgi:hypothetical protein